MRIGPIIRSNGSRNSAQNSASVQKTAQRTSSISSRLSSMPWIALRIGVEARRCEARRGAKSGGKLTAAALAPVATNRSNSRPIAWRRLVKSPTSMSSAAFKPGDRARFVQLQDQVVGPQARNVRRGVPALERIVKVVGQEDGLKPACLEDLAVPLRSVPAVVGLSQKLAQVFRGDPVVRELVECPGDFQQPRILDGRIDAIEILDDGGGPGVLVERRRNGIRGHPGGVGQLGIVVIPEDLLEMARGRPVGVDVGVRVEDRPPRHLGEELAGTGLDAAA